MTIDSQIHRIIIGTAGHIDHGKSSLVKALTGIDPDRLPEEKERGLTIDLGFAPLKLRDGTQIGIVDVPGHERFIKNMVAGATSIDFVIFVIAADDGIMPQTREHLEIMQLLGVKRGVIALTKVDLVEKEYLELVEEEIRELVKGTFLDQAPIFRVAPPTGLGMEAFQNALEKMARETPARAREGVFRMPIQRVFSSPGFGTVVTGIPISGQIQVGDRVEILPLRETGKVRGIQAFKKTVSSASAGHSSALNLSDLDYRKLSRGMVAAQPGYFQAKKVLDAKLRISSRETNALPDQTAIRLHVGTTESLGRVVLLDRKALAAGEEGFVQLKLDDPVVVAPGDRFILRLETPPVTVGGGVIVREAGKRLKRFEKETIDDLERYEKSLVDPEHLLDYVLQRSGTQPRSLKSLVEETKCSREEALKQLLALESRGIVKTLRAGESFLHQQGWEKALQLLDATLSNYFSQNPTRLVMEILSLREQSKIEESLLELLLLQRQKEGKLVLDKGKVRLAQQKANLSPALEAKKNKILDLLVQAKLSTPELEELAQLLDSSSAEVHKLLTTLVDEGEIIRCGNFYFSKQSEEIAKNSIVENIRKHGELDIPSLRDVLQTSRKYLIPLLEHFDSTGLTLRQGGRRILRS